MAHLARAYSLQSPSLGAAAAWPALHFAQNGTFQLSIFEDLHFGEAEDTDWGPQQDIKTLGVMQTVLASEDTQLVVLNGDLITGENTFRENSTDYVDRIVAPMVDANLPWASTYGSESTIPLGHESGRRVFDVEGISCL